MSTFHVKNFERFQHYKDRSPPWIKLYNELLDDYAFACLQDASKMHLIAIWLLASRSDNKIPYDPDWIARRINATEAVDLDALLNAGFIVLDQGTGQAASKPLAKRLSRGRDRGETEEEKKKGTIVPLSASADADPLSGAVDLYNEIAKEAGYPQCQRLTKRRKAALRQRLVEVGGIKGWEEIALSKARDSPFLRGETTDWSMPGIDWLIKASNFTKLMEGAYDRRNGTDRLRQAGGGNSLEEKLLRAAKLVDDRRIGAQERASDHGSVPLSGKAP